ncbi:MAG: ABC transporter permease [Salana multivorans]|nr:ABC transporter permease [Salana multivorans]
MTTATLPRVTSHVALPDAFRQVGALAHRALRMMLRKPEQMIDVIVQPLLFTAMFAYIFGGAISGGVAAYLPLLIPGILAQTALTTSMATGVKLREDMDKGVFDRFKSLPIARVAPIVGPMIADLARYLIAAVLTFATGIAMGYRPGGGIGGVACAILLVVFSGWSLAWIFAWVGTIARSATSVQGISMVILFPLTFLSNAFVPVESLPHWLAAFVRVNPVSHIVTAVRDLANSFTVGPAVVWALVGCAVVIGIFAPLAVRSYSRKM